MKLTGLDEIAEEGLTCDTGFRFYNRERPHQSLGYRTPAGLYLK